MSVWITPKTDWNSENYFNPSDRNRIEGNTDYVADLVAVWGNKPSIVNVRTNWDITDFGFYDDILKMESNINVIKDYMAAPNGYVDPVSSLPLDYNRLNIIENDLILLKTMTEKISQQFLYVGQFTCGESSIFG
jgi:hypothetical protein